MKFYAYKGRYSLGKEPLGTFGKMMFELKTVEGAIRKVTKVYGPDVSIYSYTNFYRDETFRRIY